MILRLLAGFLLLFPPVLWAATPHAPELAVCWDYGCSSRTGVTLPEPVWRQVQAFFLPAASSPAVERERIRKAITLMDRTIGKLTPVGNDYGGSQPWAGLPGQQDCIDESLTTLSELEALERAGLLHWHRVAGRARRAPHLFDVHWTAVIEEKATGRRFAVDPWYGDQGEPPVIQPLADWLHGVKPPDLPPRTRSRGLASRLLMQSLESDP